jgi:hypothetical protein
LYASRSWFWSQKRSHPARRSLAGALGCLILARFW